MRMIKVCLENRSQLDQGRGLTLEICREISPSLISTSSTQHIYEISIIILPSQMQGGGKHSSFYTWIQIRIWTLFWKWLKNSGQKCDVAGEGEVPWDWPQDSRQEVVKPHRWRHWRSFTTQPNSTNISVETHFWKNTWPSTSTFYLKCYPLT